MQANGDESFKPGTTFGRYVIEKQLGTGGMGAVYAATHQDLGKRVALKTLHRANTTNPEAVARFLREGRAASRIAHPNVVDVFDVGTQDGVPFLVMELLEGEDLGRLIERAAPMTASQAVDLLVPVLAAVGTAHDEGIVHRDIKPENIFLARTRQMGIEPKVLDFGISKIGNDPQAALALTNTSALLGTPYYMSPEQARGGKNVDARADLYAIGVILYECLTAQLPFTGNSLYDVLHAIVEGNFTPPREVRPEIPAALEAVVLRAMKRVREERYDSALEFGRDLCSFASPRVRNTWEPFFFRPSLRPPGAEPSRPRDASAGSQKLPGLLTSLVSNGLDDAKTTVAEEPRAVPTTSTLSQSVVELDRKPASATPPSRPGRSARIWVGAGIVAGTLAIIGAVALRGGGGNMTTPQPTRPAIAAPAARPPAAAPTPPVAPSTSPAPPQVAPTVAPPASPTSPTPHVAQPERPVAPPAPAVGASRTTQSGRSTPATNRRGNPTPRTPTTRRTYRVE